MPYALDELAKKYTGGYDINLIHHYNLIEACNLQAQKMEEYYVANECNTSVLFFACCYKVGVYKPSLNAYKKIKLKLL